MSGIKFDYSKLMNGLAQLSKKDIAIMTELQTEAIELQDHMKQNAPWTDRTGQARRSLNVKVKTIKNGYRLVLSHGVDYGVDLELKHNKKYAIIQPTIQTKGQEVVKSFNNFMSKL